MDSPPEQPENKEQERHGVLTAAQVLKDRVFASHEPGISSLGEFLLPTLLGTMESCWMAVILIGLASLGLFESTEPLMPFWAPFILIVGTIWLFHYLGLRSAKRPSDAAKSANLKITAPDAPVFIAVVAVLALFFAWLHIYAQTAFLFDPRWLLALLNDILLLNLHFYETVIIIGLSFLLGWRGIRLLNREIEPSNIFRELCLGLGIMIAVIMLRAARASAGVVFHDDGILLFLIPIFLFLSLAAQALARVVFIRHSHPTGLQGNIVVQERAIIMVIGSLGLVFLLVALLVSSTLNPSFLQSLAPLGAAIARAYDWLVGLVADLAVLIAIPFFWLVELFSRLFPAKAPKSTTPQGQPPRRPQFTPHPPTSADVILPFVKIILPIVFLLVIFALIWWTLRGRRRKRITINHKKEDVHESLWSWPLFWAQFKAIIHVLFARFFPRAATTGAEDTVASEEIKGEPAARTIREIYRAFLKKAAGRGYSRRKYETPHEFKQRLDEKVPLVEPQLEAITEVYALTRYGESVPDETQLDYVRGMWAELDQKWV